MATNMKFISRIIVVCVILQTSSTQESMEETHVLASSSTELKDSSIANTTSTLTPSTLSRNVMPTMDASASEPQRLFVPALTRETAIEEEVLVDPRFSATNKKTFLPTSSPNLSFATEDLLKSPPSTDNVLVMPLLKEPHQILKTAREPVVSVVTPNDEEASVPALRPIATAAVAPFNVEPNVVSSGVRNSIVASTPSTLTQLGSPQLTSTLSSFVPATQTAVTGAQILFPVLVRSDDSTRVPTASKGSSLPVSFLTQASQTESSTSLLAPVEPDLSRITANDHLSFSTSARSTADMKIISGSSTPVPVAVSQTGKPLSIVTVLDKSVAEKSVSTSDSGSQLSEPLASTTSKSLATTPLEAKANSASPAVVIAAFLVSAASQQPSSNISADSIGPISPQLTSKVQETLVGDPAIFAISSQAPLAGPPVLVSAAESPLPNLVAATTASQIGPFQLNPLGEQTLPTPTQLLEPSRIKAVEQLSAPSTSTASPTTKLVETFTALTPALQSSPRKVKPDELATSLVSSTPMQPKAFNLSTPLTEETVQLSLPTAKSVAEATTHAGTFAASITTPTPTPTPAREQSVSLLPADSTTQLLPKIKELVRTSERSISRITSLSTVTLPTPTSSTYLPTIEATTVTHTIPPSSTSAVSNKPKKIRKFPKYRSKTKRRRTTTKKPEVVYTTTTMLPTSAPSVLPIMSSNGALEPIPGMPLSGGHFFNQLIKALVDHQH